MATAGGKAAPNPTTLDDPPFSAVIVCHPCDPMPASLLRITQHLIAQHVCEQVVVIPFGSDYTSPAGVTSTSRCCLAHVAVAFEAPQLQVRVSSLTAAQLPTLDIVKGVVASCWKQGSKRIALLQPESREVAAFRSWKRVWASAKLLRLYLLDRSHAALSKLPVSGRCGLPASQTPEALSVFAPLAICKVAARYGLYGVPSHNKLVGFLDMPAPATATSGESKCGDGRSVAVLGGSFNPITDAHLHVATEIIAAKAANEVWVVPCGPRPDKQSLQTPALDRFLLAVVSVEASIPTSMPVYVSALETYKPKAVASFTLMRELGHLHPSCSFCLVIGSDLIPTLPRWQHGKELWETQAFLVVPRPGYSMDVAMPPHSKPLVRVDGSMPQVPGLSSTMVRDRLRSGDPIGGLVPTPSAAIIAKYQLLRSSL